MDRTLAVHFSQFVRAPIQRVYAAYVDPALMPRWMGIKAIASVSGPLDRTGATFVEVVAGPYRPHTEVLAADPPVLHEMGSRAIAGIEWRWTARFATKLDGTEITFDATTTFPAGILSTLLRRSQEGGRMERGTRRRLAAFAALVEDRERWGLGTGSERLTGR